MISLKRYLDRAETGASNQPKQPEDPRVVFAALEAAYRSALQEMASSGQKVCALPGAQLKQTLSAVEQELASPASKDTLMQAEGTVRTALRDWSQHTAEHYQARAREVKELLLALARTAHSVGERDGHCAVQMNHVTERLKMIASLEDVTEIRSLVEESATELRASIDRMTSAGKVAMDELRAEITSYRTRLQDAEYVASRDTLTGLGNRQWGEGQIAERMRAGSPFCALMIDIDGFKRVNDQHGHVVGDELLKQFASELRSACRLNDVACRWGGDEFVVLMSGTLAEGEVQCGRLREWISGNYTLQVLSAALTVRVRASVGIAAYVPGESMQQLIDHADSSMYHNKTGAAQLARGA